MTGPRDIADDFVRTLFEWVDQWLRQFEGVQFNEAARVHGIVMIERRVREEFGGKRVYIHRAGWNNNLEQRDASIRARKAQGFSYREIAREFCLSDTHVRRIARGQRMQSHGPRERRCAVFR